LGKPADATSGLNLLGARNYDPVTGRILSVDPLFESDDPNQMGGYGYAAGNPVSGTWKGKWCWRTTPSWRMSCENSLRSSPAASTTMTTTPFW